MAAFLSRPLLLSFSIGLLPVALFAQPAQRDLGRVLPAGRPLHVVAFGDFGTGNSHQAAVAHAIAQRNASLPFDLGITMGDNFYFCGVRSVEDPKWKTRWEDFYTPLGIPFYASLGNHDYGHPPVICPMQRSSPDAEVAYTAHSKSWRMPARYYTYKAGPVLFIAIDTEGWSAEQLAWIKTTLAASAADPTIKWRIVYGHHPIYTSGVHLNERRISVLRAQLLPVLKAAHVDAYICGHDHDLEHLRADGMEFLICGGGGAKLRAFAGSSREPISVSSASKYAFLDLVIDDHKFVARFLDINLKSLEDPPLTDTK
ncbi:MAG TPA: metallophosphoesterase [Bryobacteraceae bacterium]|jgi:hypothetical protein